MVIRHYVYETSCSEWDSVMFPEGLSLTSVRGRVTKELGEHLNTQGENTYNRL